MATLIAFHDVDDVDHWLSSPKRSELLAPMGITVRDIYRSGGSNRTGVIMDVPDMDAFQELMESDTAAEAMKFDGVQADTLVLLVEA